MRIVISTVLLLLVGCSPINKVTYIGVPDGTPLQNVARVHNTTPAIQIISVDGNSYSQKTPHRTANEALYLAPGKHSISVEYCICSADGSTYIEGVHTFSADFVADHDYGLVFNYAPPNKHELWLSHVYVNEKGREKKELAAKLGPFELKRTSTIYVPVYR